MVDLEEQIECVRISKTLKPGDVFLIDAVAGSGKSTVLKKIAKESPDDNILMLCFNKAIQQHFEKWKIPNVESSTINAYCLKIINTRLEIENIDNAKYMNILQSYLGPRRFNSFNISTIDRILGLYFNTGAIFDEDDRNIVRHVNDIVTKNNIRKPYSFPNYPDLYLVMDQIIRKIKSETMSCLTHDHCVYLAIKEIQKNPWRTVYNKIMIDEYQDLSPLNQMLLDCLIQSKRSAVIFVGDHSQGIYAFRGAALSVKTDIMVKYSPVVASLSTCFRCTQEICDLASIYRKKKITSFRTDSSAISEVEKKDAVSLLIAKYRDPSIKTLAFLHKDNAPLEDIFLELLNNDVPCMMSDPDRIHKLFTPGTVSNAQLIGYTQKNSIRHDANALIAALRSSPKFVDLSTIHAAKGREFDYVLCEWPELPANFTVNDKTQMDNLRYVMITRTLGDFGIIRASNSI